jgi:addiction module RelE/StbE family toxin
MKVRYSRRALTQLDQIFSYIAKDNPAAASAVVERIDALATLLGRYPTMGRPTDKEGVRVMGVRRHPYLVFYKILPDRDEVRILRVRHMARRPLTTTPER